MTVFTRRGISSVQESHCDFKKLWYVTQEDCVSLHTCVCVWLYVCMYTVIVMVKGGVASLCGTQRREQVGSGWSRESVLIVFVPQSCLAVVKAASTSWEANCSIYTGRRFLFFFFYLFIYFTMGDVCMIYSVTPALFTLFAKLPKLQRDSSEEKVKLRQN